MCPLHYPSTESLIPILYLHNAFFSLFVIVIDLFYVVVCLELPC